ncbi:MAG: T9SS C-terminal target domain-containing protein [Bacteroidetes bacterium]|nr:MAG: T9SS C-terminal target domain-containing protein [Bacteroidota bacterium]
MGLSLHEPSNEIMLRQFISSALLLLALGAGKQVFAQCLPDTANCSDIGNPGEFCPRLLPEATVDQHYETVITVISPSSFTLPPPYGTIEIEYIVVDSVKNMPDGITYQANADRFYGDSAYCIVVLGTPTTAGEYPLSLHISPFINISGTIIKYDQVVDDTSVVVVVHGPSNLDPGIVNNFRVLNAVPNPYSDITRMGFYTPFDDRIELKVFNILGEMVHREVDGYPHGEHYFGFDGSELLPGTYFYRVTNHEGYHTGKFIKTR